MALATAGCLEVAALGSDGNAGSDTNPGWFNPGSANFLTNLSCDTSTPSVYKISSASYTFVAGDVGSWVFIQGGTNWLPGWYKITSVAGGVATVNAAIGAAVLYSTPGPYAVNTVAGCVNGSYVSGTASGTGGVDYSQAGTPSFTTGAATTTATTTVTTASAAKSWLGNGIFISGGGNTTGIYEVTAVTAGVSCTVTGGASLVNGASVTVTVGGCLASPGQAGANMVSGNHVYAKGNNTFLITSATGNVSGGCMTLPNATSNANMTWVIGYNALRGDSPTGSARPIFQASGAISAFTIVKATGQSLASFLILDCASKTTSIGINVLRAYYVTVKNCTGGGISMGVGGAILCDATGCATTNVITGSSAMALYCVAWSNSTNGIVNVMAAVFCLSVNNSGGGHGFFASGVTGTYVQCTAFGNGGDGFRGASLAINISMSCINCVSYGNTGLGYNCTAATDIMFLISCAAGNNSTNFATNISLDSQLGNITLSANPFTNSAGGDFSTNTTAGGGALLRAFGIIGALPGVSTTTAQDVGASQHADPVGGAGQNRSILASGLSALG
jgi:hypothetical protein